MRLNDKMFNVVMDKRKPLLLTMKNTSYLIDHSTGPIELWTWREHVLDNVKYDVSLNIIRGIIDEFIRQADMLLHEIVIVDDEKALSCRIEYESEGV